MRNRLTCLTSIAAHIGLLVRVFGFVLLVPLMIIGGCVGSVGGGAKVLRIGVLFEMVRGQMGVFVHGSALLQPAVVERGTTSS